MKETTIKFNDNDYVKICPLTSSMIRIRMNNSDSFKMSSTEKLGIVNTNWDEIDYSVNSQNDIFSITLGQLSLKINTVDGIIALEEDNKVLLKMSPHSSSKGIGVGASFEIDDSEKFYGLGYRKTDFIQLRGHALRNHVSYGQCYGPNPFLMSSRGWGVYFNTIFDSYFDVGETQSDILNIWCEKGELDFYIMMGNYPSLLDSFTQVTGRPSLMPLWGYGLMFICNEKENQFDILHDASDFISKKIPCDTFGLEPGWMSKYYDTSIDKDWDREKFYMPWWDGDRKDFSNVTFLGALRRFSIHMSLWLCCDYDVFAEEKRLEDVNKPDINEKAFERPICFDKLDFDPKAHQPIIMDKVTDPKQPWFEHLKKFIDDGVAAFKQDPAYIINDHPDRIYANGMNDEEAHNIYTTVLAKQVYQGFREYTGTRPMHFMGTAFTGIQHWAPTWTCDCGGRDEALMGILLHSMCGHMNITCDMDAHSAEGIHYGFLLPWSLLNSWAFIDHPWWLGAELYDIFLCYAKLHYSLIPYIYSYAQLGHLTGMPIVRAMPLVYPDDICCENLTHQYMLGDYLLVGAFSNQIYLPAGKWTDFWTGTIYEGNRDITYDIPKGKGGALFIKEGAILPCWENVERAVSENNKEILLHIYPTDKSDFTLYEDDGEHFGYEKNEVARTTIICEKDDHSYKINIQAENQKYKGFEGNRKFVIIIHGEKGKSVFLNDMLVTEKGAFDLSEVNYTVILTGNQIT